MAAINYNFDIEKGSNFVISFVYNDSNGNPVNLTDKCVTWSLIDNSGTTRIYSNKAIDPYLVKGWSLTANNLGIIDIKLSADETQKFNFVSALYDLDVKETTNSKENIRLSTGSIGLINRNVAPPSECSISSDPIVATSVPLPTSTASGDVPQPTPTPVAEITDFCLPLPYGCGPIDLFSTVYPGSGLVINDMSSATGSVIVSNTGLISNIELAINKLSHQDPTDLVMLLQPPSGNKILLAANQNISNFSNNFSFMFSNKANSGQYLHNISNGESCRIYNKTSLINYNNETLLSGFDHLFNYAVTGAWNLIVKDTDPVGSGSIDSWKLIITYQNDLPDNHEPFDCGISP